MRCCAGSFGNFPGRHGSDTKKEDSSCCSMTAPAARTPFKAPLFHNQCSPSWPGWYFCTAAPKRVLESTQSRSPAPQKPQKGASPTMLAQATWPESLSALMRLSQNKKQCSSNVGMKNWQFGRTFWHRFVSMICRTWHLLQPATFVMCWRPIYSFDYIKITSKHQESYGNITEHIMFGNMVIQTFANEIIAYLTFGISDLSFSKVRNFEMLRSWISLLYNI